MSALVPADHRRLRSSLALLDSDKEGEQLAALAAVKRILVKVGFGFADLANGLQPRLVQPREQPNPWHPRQEGPRPADLLQPHQRQAALLLACGHPWDDWERGFLNSIRIRSKGLTAGQRDKLAECIAIADAARNSRGAGDADS